MKPTEHVDLYENADGKLFITLRGSTTMADITNDLSAGFSYDADNLFSGQDEGWGVDWIPTNLGNLRLIATYTRTFTLVSQPAESYRQYLEH